MAGTAPPHRTAFDLLGTAGDFRTWLSAVVVLGFFAAYGLNWYAKDEKTMDLMNGALIAQFTGAVGYWLGSSRGSDAKSGTIDTMATAVAASASAGTGDVVVPPGGTVDTTTNVKGNPL